MNTSVAAAAQIANNRAQIRFESEFSREEKEQKFCVPLRFICVRVCICVCVRRLRTELEFAVHRSALAIWLLRSLYIISNEQTLETTTTKTTMSVVAAACDGDASRSLFSLLNAKQSATQTSRGHETAENSRQPPTPADTLLLSIDHRDDNKASSERTQLRSQLKSISIRLQELKRTVTTE